jgi:hypothetical protein
MNIICYSYLYKEKIINLLGYMWKDLNEVQRVERFVWRYEKNPYQDETYICLALDEEKVVGFRGFVLQHFIKNGKIFKVFSPADAIVHPSYRRLGLFSRLTTICLENIYSHFPNNSLVLNLSSNHLSTQGNLKQGWQITNGLKNYAYRLSFASYITKKIFRTDPEGKQLGEKIVRDGYHLEISDHLNSQEMSKLVAQNRDPKKFSNIRDNAYYQWRYSYQSEKYFYVYCWHKNQLRAFAVIHKRSKYEVTLCEYCASDLRAMNMILDLSARKGNTPIMRTHSLSNHDKFFNRSCGFIEEPSWILKIIKKERLPVIVRPSRPKIDENDFWIDGSDIRDINNWQLYLADTH